MSEEIVKDGVNPVNEILFGVCTSGRKKEDTASTVQTTTVKDAESLNIAINGQVQEWNPMDAEGWVRRLMTAKSISISMGGKRNYGDVGNDYVAGLAWKNGQDCNSWMSITFPNGDKLMIPCVINVTALGGDSTAVEALTWEALSDGRPEYIEYTAEQ